MPSAIRNFKLSYCIVNCKFMNVLRYSKFPRNGIYNLECLVGVAISSLHNDTITLLLVKTAS